MNNAADIQATRAKAKALANSRPFDVHKWSEYPEVNGAVDALYEDLRSDPQFKGSGKLRKKHIKVIILDLYAKCLTDPSMYVAYSRRKNDYVGDKRYNKLHISYLTPKIVDALVTRGYVENHKGYYDRKSGNSRMSRMRATQELINLIVSTHHIVPRMIQVARNKECIILRDIDDETGKRIEVPYEDTAETNRMRREITAYNNLLRQTFVDVPFFDRLNRSRASPVTIDWYDKFVRRIFNNASWEDGGRYYGGWWQRLPKVWRKLIAID